MGTEARTDVVELPVGERARSSAGVAVPASVDRAVDAPARRLRQRAPGRSRARVLIGAVVILGIAALIVTVLISMAGQAGSTTTLGAPTPSATASPGVRSAELFVHVLGAVATPGVYRLSDGDRVIDAIAAAGGFSGDAEHGGVNLARFLSDGEQILVPRLGEAISPGDGTGGSAPGPVNLNTATAEQLDTLPRIGAAMAARIIAWREANGRFTSVDDLLSVAGIGEKTVDALRELVTV